MGASFVTTQYAKDDFPEECDVHEQLRELISQSGWEDGHSYSGNWGMAEGVEFRHSSFESREAAEDWLEENCQKWGPALIVSTNTHWICGAWCAS